MQAASGQVGGRRRTAGARADDDGVGLDDS